MYLGTVTNGLWKNLLSCIKLLNTNIKKDPSVLSTVHALDPRYTEETTKTTATTQAIGVLIFMTRMCHVIKEQQEISECEIQSQINFCNVFHIVFLKLCPVSRRFHTVLFQLTQHSHGVSSLSKSCKNPRCGGILDSLWEELRLELLFNLGSLRIIGVEGSWDGRYTPEI